MITGRIKHWNPAGFGFVLRDDTGNSVFAHISNFVDRLAPEKGQRVEFDVINDPRTNKPRAVNVRCK